MTIHSTVIVEPDARLADDVSIGPFGHIESGAVVGPGARLASHIVVRAGVTLGARVDMDSFTAIGGRAQMMGMKPDHLGQVIIGDDVVMREGVTVHASTLGQAATSVGEGSFLMAHAHVAHDCQVGAHAILTNGVLLGGHVMVGDYAILGGGSGFHQHVRIGTGAMVAGKATITSDVPPFTMAGERNILFGLNTKGLIRRGVPREVIDRLKACFREVVLPPGDPCEVAKSMLTENGKQCTEVQQFLSFFAGSKRGFCRVASTAGARRYMARTEARPERSPREAYAEE